MQLKIFMTLKLLLFVMYFLYDAFIYYDSINNFVRLASMCPIAIFLFCLFSVLQTCDDCHFNYCDNDEY